MKTVFTHWMTSAAGVVAGALYVTTGTHDMKQIATAFGIALIGILSKDLNK